MLAIKAVTKIFNPGTINEQTALHNVDLILAKGDYVTLIGGNGSGKSTLLNCIAGVYDVDSGTIVIDGNDFTSCSEHKRAKVLGRVFQDPMVGTTSGMSIEENLALALRRGGKRNLNWGIRQGERQLFKKALEYLDLGLEDRLKVPVGLLSGGQRQALTLLMATLKRPKVLLLDEHTAALDPKTATKVLGLTDCLIKENKLTALMVTHNLRDAIEYGNRLIMMHAGKIILDIKGEAKKKITVEYLLKGFGRVGGKEIATGRALLA